MVIGGGDQCPAIALAGSIENRLSRGTARSSAFRTAAWEIDALR
jgi:hypothetical protein